MDHRIERKIKRTKPQDRKNIARIDDEGIGRNRKDGGYRVNCKNKICDFDENET